MVWVWLIPWEFFVLLINQTVTNHWSNCQQLVMGNVQTAKFDQFQTFNFRKKSKFRIKISFYCLMTSITHVWDVWLLALHKYFIDSGRHPKCHQSKFMPLVCKKNTTVDFSILEKNLHLSSKYRNRTSLSITDMEQTKKRIIQERIWS